MSDNPFWCKACNTIYEHECKCMKFDNERLNLEILAEEAAEVIRIKSKCIRFGMDDFHPKNGMPNRESLAEEIGHFIAMVEILIENGTIKEGLISQAINNKKQNLKKWYTMPNKEFDHMIDENYASMTAEDFLEGEVKPIVD